MVAFTLFIELKNAFSLIIRNIYTHLLHGLNHKRIKDARFKSGALSVKKGLHNAYHV